jgi:diketogulonate reductase-like aldo/keto reductase
LSTILHPFLQSRPSFAYSFLVLLPSFPLQDIDSAGYYDNEAQVGSAVSDSSTTSRRSDVFITTKILFPAEGNDANKTYADLVQGVDKFGLKEDGGRVDLFLIHTPSSGPEGTSLSPIELAFHSSGNRQKGKERQKMLN